MFSNELYDPEVYFELRREDWVLYPDGKAPQIDHFLFTFVQDHRRGRDERREEPERGREGYRQTPSARSRERQPSIKGNLPAAGTSGSRGL